MSRSAYLIVTVVLGVCLALPKPAIAAETKYDFNFFPGLDIPILVGFGAIWLVPTFISSELPQDFCAPCDPNDINALDRTVIDFGYPWARTASDVSWLAVTTATVGLSFLGWKDGGAGEVFTDIGIIAESMAITGAMHQVIRHAFHRPRPYMYKDPLDEKYRIGADKDWLSFFSGHTATVFAAATSFSYLFSRRKSGSEYRTARSIVWATSMTMAALTGLWRVLAGDHFWTDVIAGIAIGIAVGLIVPRLHQSEETIDNDVPEIGASNQILSFGFVF